MSLLAILCSILLQKFRPLREPEPLVGWLSAMADWLERKLNAGEHRHGWAAWFAMMLALFGVLTAAHYAINHYSELGTLLLHIVVLYLSLRLRPVLKQFATIQRTLRREDLNEARTEVARWTGRDTQSFDRGQLTKVAIEYAIECCYRGFFAPVFWYVLLPGPAGAVLYRAADMVAQRWSKERDPAQEAFHEVAAKALTWIDWLPQRVTAASFAIVGDFEDSLYCWRSQASSWDDSREGVVLAAAAGALGVRLGDPLLESGGARFRPPLGVGTDPEAGHLQSAEGMVWRAVVLWMVVLLLVTVVQVLL